MSVNEKPAWARDPCPSDPHDPFDHVTLTRERGADGEPNAMVMILGERQGGERSRRVPYQQVWDYADGHLQELHGKSIDEADPAEFQHAIIRACVAFLMD